MSDIVGSINLERLDETAVVSFSGQTGVFIPFKPNPSIFHGKKGTYLNVKIKELRTANTYGNTHMFLAQVTSSSERDALGDNLSSKQPIIGNGKAVSFSRADAVPQASAVVSSQDDLPM